MKLAPAPYVQGPNLGHCAACEVLQQPEISKTEVPFKSFQEWSQMQTIEANKKEKPHVIKPQFQKLLDKHPDILKTDFHIKEPKHGVVHHIDT